MGFAAVEAALEEAVAKKAFPGAVLRVSRDGEKLFEHAVGSRALVPSMAPVSVDTVFDLSSLTKPLATTLAILLLVRDHRLDIDERVGRYLPNFAVFGKKEVTLRHLLNHSSGLVAHRPFFKEASRLGRPNFVGSREARPWIYEQVHRERSASKPGTRMVYSDLGFIILGQLVETASAMTLDEFCRRRIFGPAQLKELGFIDLTMVRAGRVAPVSERIAATSKCSWRGKVLCGEVEDENAWTMAGVAGHAGLFGTAADVDTLATLIESAGRKTGGLLPRELVREMWTLDEQVVGSTRTLGWDTPAAKNSAAGTRMSGRTVGHLGFTGTSLWLDLEQRVHIILLTNRVHPSRDNEKIREWRPRLHDLVMEALA
ncbi:MAG: serine hydrolase domain-containing protein [Deltaproteobacteria bacterium]